MQKLIQFITSVFLVSFSVIAFSSADECNIYTPCNEVSSFVQEGDYLWWTGRYGIVKYNRFDGTHRIYTYKNYGEGNGWTAAAVAPDGVKWFGSGGGMILRFDNSEWKVFKELYRNGRANNISAIVFDREGMVWFGTGYGAASFDGSEWKQYGTAVGFTDKKVLSTIYDRSGNLWFGTETEGLFRFDGDTWTRYTASEDSLPSNRINAIACDENGVIWVGTNRGLAVFNNGIWKTLPPLGDPELPLENQVTALAPDREGGIWVGTKANLVYLRGEEKTVYTAANSTLADEPYKQVHAMLLDTDGILWVSQWFSQETPLHLGLARFDGKNWLRVKIPMPVGNNTFSVAVDEDNVKWFTTSGLQTGHPLVSFDGVAWKQYTEADGLAGLGVNSITIDDACRKWFCTEKGVSCFDGKTWKNYTAENGLPGNNALKGAIDRNGIGWFSLDTGLYSFDGSAWTSWNDSVLVYDISGDGVVLITCIGVDQKNVKWIGTERDGVLSFDGVIWKHYTKEDNLSGNFIRFITVDHNNVIWVGTGLLSNEAGISCFDGNIWTNFEYAKQVIFQAITGIAVDEMNIKWFVANGLYSFDGATWKKYSQSTWGDNYNCIAIDQDGVKWLGAAHIGVVSFRESDGTSTAVTLSNDLPKGFAILGNQPNPFNPSTTITFSLPAAIKIDLIVYDITGRKVRTLISGHLSAGNHSSVWDGTDETGLSVSSGVYIARLESGKSAHSRKMLLVR